MRRLLALLAATQLLSACGTLPGTSLPEALTTTALGADQLGGLPSGEAAHASVEAAQPTAFVLVPEASEFLMALESSVEPMREKLATILKSDATVTQGIGRWSTGGSKGQLATLSRVATLEAEVMGCQAPSVVEDAGTPPQQGMLAYYQPGTTDLGQITIYTASMTAGGPYLAIATLVHEMRHAAQYQLVEANSMGGLGLSADQRTLASWYSNAWQVMDAWGGEAQLSYGDYAHLAVEYDAFQTGNEVASLVSGGTYSALGSGFVDAQYTTTTTPKLDLATILSQYGAGDLVGTVNAAEARAEASGAVSRGQVVPLQRHAITFGRFGRGG